MENEIYPIMTEDGKMFCKCRNDGTTVELIGKNCSMSIQELVQRHQIRKWHSSAGLSGKIERQNKFKKKMLGNPAIWPQCASGLFPPKHWTVRL